MKGPEVPLTRFVILAAPRTGSNMLCTLLDSHPDILCHHEIYNPTGIFYALGLRDGSFDLGTMAYRECEPLAFLDRLWENPLGHGCVGFKMTRGQSETVLQAVVQDRSISKIVLKRRNRIKTYLSEAISRQTGQWEVYRESELVANRPLVHVQIEELLENVSVNETYYRDIENSLTATAQNYFQLAYEDLVGERDRRRLLEFLGVSPCLDRLRVASVKQNSTDARDLVANFAELEAALAGSPFAAELYAPGY